MDDLRVSVDLTELMKMDVLARVGLFANLAAQVEIVARQGEANWHIAIKNTPGIWQGERDAYEAAIRLEQTGPYAWVLVNDYKYVEDIETGRPAFDLKRMLNTSMKVRVSKKGVRYLIVPFRHNSPGNTAHAPAMPTNVYAEAKQLAPSLVTGHGRRRSGTGAYNIDSQKPITVRQRKYVWGGRLQAGLTPKLQTRHKTDPTAGMVRFGAGAGSVYLTFRVMSENSHGWIIPAKPGLYLAKGVADNLQKIAERDFEAAALKDFPNAA